MFFSGNLSGPPCEIWILVESDHDPPAVIRGTLAAKVCSKHGETVFSQLQPLGDISHRCQKRSFQWTGVDPETIEIVSIQVYA